MQLKIKSGTSIKDYTLTSAYAKPYVNIANSSVLPLTTNTITGMQLKFKIGNQTYRALEYKGTSSASYLTTADEARKLTNATALTRVSTSDTKYSTRVSTSDTEYLTRVSTSGTSYLTKDAGWHVGVNNTEWYTTENYIWNTEASSHISISAKSMSITTSYSSQTGTWWPYEYQEATFTIKYGYITYSFSGDVSISSYYTRKYNYQSTANASYSSSYTRESYVLQRYINVGYANYYNFDSTFLTGFAQGNNSTSTSCSTRYQRGDEPWTTWYYSMAYGSSTFYQNMIVQTTSTQYLTRVSTYSTEYKTRASTYSTDYKTRVSTSGWTGQSSSSYWLSTSATYLTTRNYSEGLSSTTALTCSSTSSIEYLTRVSTSSIDYLTRVSTSSIDYLTRISTSGESYLTAKTYDPSNYGVFATNEGCSIGYNYSDSFVTRSTGRTAFYTKGQLQNQFSFSSNRYAYDTYNLSITANRRYMTLPSIQIYTSQWKTTCFLDKNSHREYGSWTTSFSGSYSTDFTTDQFHDGDLWWTGGNYLGKSTCQLIFTGAISTFNSSTTWDLSSSVNVTYDLTQPAIDIFDRGIYYLYTKGTSYIGNKSDVATTSTIYLTRASTYDTKYYTCASTSSTVYHTCVSTSATNYYTRSSTSGYSGVSSSSDVAHGEWV